MNTIDSALYRNPWDFPQKRTDNEKPFYICVSGNSGAGKSTLIGSVGHAIHKNDTHTIVVDEKSLHHPLLPYLFYEPKNFAYELQLNFMIQRVLLIKNWLLNGYNLVMERSHLEDIIFIKHLLKEKFITTEEHDTYLSVWSQLTHRLPNPDLIFFIDVSPESSLVRLDESEKKGERPREFPDDVTKTRWINSWYQLYVQRMAELSNDKIENMKLIILDGKKSAEEITQQALEAIDLKNK